jgi:hypothetical protein
MLQFVGAIEKSASKNNEQFALCNLPEMAVVCLVVC